MKWIVGSMICIIIVLAGCSNSISGPAEFDDLWYAAPNITLQFIDRDGPNCTCLFPEAEYVCSSVDEALTGTEVSYGQYVFSIPVISYYYLPGDTKCQECHWTMYLQYLGHGDAYNINNWDIYLPHI